MTIFDHLKNITETKPNWSDLTEEDKKTWNIYMVAKFLSMNRDYIEFVNEFQKYQSLTPEHVYTVYCAVIPQKKVWLKFIKSTTKEANKELIKMISTYFECSHEEAKTNLKLLSNEQISDILSDYGLSQKEIKKLLK